MSDRMKPPPRSKGRVLGATTKKTAPPPPFSAAELSSEARLDSGGFPAEGQGQAQAADHAPRSGAPQNTLTDPAAAQAAEVAVHSAALPPTAGTTFPVRHDVRGLRYEQDARAEPAASEGTPWAHGPGRPADIPEASVVLNQRIIARESRDSSVPAALKLEKRIKRFDLDEWLTTRGF